MKEKKEFALHFREVQPKFARLCMRSLSHSGLTMPQYALLNLLANGAVPMKDLSVRMHITKPAVTNLVDRLEKHDFLKRGPDSSDRRITMIAIRPKGSKLVREMQSTVLGFLLRTLGEFSSSERGVITRFYKMLSKNFDQNLLKKKAGKLVSLGLAVMLFTGSSSASAMARRPEKDPAESRTAVVSASETFNPKVLNFENFIRLAISRSEIVKSRREDIMIARAKTFQSLGEAIGDGDFVISHSFQEKQAEAAAGGSGSDSTARSPHRRERKFMFSQPLFQGFKSVGALMGAGSLKGQRVGELEFSKEELFVEAADAFYALISAEKDLVILGESQKLFEERIKDLGEREKIGRSRLGEVAMARAKMKILEARVAKARGTLLSAQSLVSFYTGIPHAKVEDEDPETFSETVDLNPENYAEFAAKRSDVVAAGLAAYTAKQTIVVKQSALWPKLTLDANHYEKREGFQDGISWDALIKLNVPLYRGGDNIGQILEATANYRKAKLNYELVQKQALLEIEQVHQNWIAAREQNRAYQEAVKASEENFNFQKEDYAHSLVSNLDVLAALEEFLTIREDANTAQYEMKTNYWKLQIAISSHVPEWADQTKDSKRKTKD